MVVGPYTADIRWTEYGVPHIQADEYGSLGFGMGYALARDHVCTLADQIVKVRSERSKYFGEGEEQRHINSDFGWLVWGVVAQAEAHFYDLPETLRTAIVGYAAGYSIGTSGKWGGWVADTVSQCPLGTACDAYRLTCALHASRTVR